MAKLTLASILSGFYSTDKLNTNFTDICTALENTLSRDGTSPNTMSADLDLNGNSLLNAVIGAESYTVATAPSAVTRGAGSLIYVTDGNVGVACLACSDGTNWKVIALGSTIAAS
jgi:hypothetical protein